MDMKDLSNGAVCPCKHEKSSEFWWRGKGDDERCLVDVSFCFAFVVHLQLDLCEKR